MPVNRRRAITRIVTGVAAVTVPYVTGEYRVLNSDQQPEPNPETVNESDDSSPTESVATEESSSSTDSTNTDSDGNDESSDTGEDSESSDDSLIVSIDHDDTVIEGSIEYVSFSVRNPSDTTQTEHITVTRDSRETLYKEVITLQPGEEISETVNWYVRNDAAGHSMQLIISAADTTDSTLVSGVPPFTPEVVDTAVDAEAGRITVTFTVSNTGTAPGTHDITVDAAGETVLRETVHLGIAGEKTFTEVIDVDTSPVDVQITTELTTLIRTVG